MVFVFFFPLRISALPKSLAPVDHLAHVLLPPHPWRPSVTGTEPADSCLSCFCVLGSQACHALATAYTPLLVVLCAAAGAEFLSPATTPVVKPGAKGHGTSFPGSALRDSMDTGLLTPDGGREGQLVGPVAHPAPLALDLGPWPLAPIGKVLLRGVGYVTFPASWPPWSPMVLRTQGSPPLWSLEGHQVGHLGRSGELCKAVGRHAAKPAVCTVSRTCVQRQQRLQRQRSFGCAFWL